MEKPLLAIVLKELRRDLQSRQQRNRIIYAKHNNYYWSEKEADFARTAEEVWAAEKQSGAACQYIAEYLFGGLDHYSRAIEILLDAHRREVLDEGGQSRLVEFLRGQNRFAETIPILEPLVQRRPDNLQYRVWLMNAYFKTGKSGQLAKLLKETHDYFHQEQSLERERHGHAGPKLPGERNLSTRRSITLRKRLPSISARPRAAGSATACSRAITATRPGPSPA